MTDLSDLLSKQSIDFIQRKTLKPTFSWLDNWGEEHAHSLSVAKATQLDILEDFQAELIKSEKSGKGFKEGVKPKLIEKGWWGKQVREDPLTGELKTVQLGSDRRLKTIYRANIRTARAAGQWERAQHTKKTLPYFMYQLGASEHHREHHVAIAGTILPVNHAYWDTHFPPNGWGCKCRVRQITNVEAARKGYDPKKSAPKIEYKEFTNKRTGEILKLPADIDAGWSTNAGKARANTLMQHLTGRITTAGEASGRKVIQELWADEKYIKTIAALPNENKVHIPIAISERMAKKFKTDKSTIMIGTDTLNLKREARKVQKFDLKFDDFGKIQTILDDGHILHDKRRKNYSILHLVGKLWFKVEVNISKAGFMHVQAFCPIEKKRAIREIEKG